MHVLDQKTGRWRRVVAVALAGAAIVASQTGAASAAGSEWTASAVPGTGYANASDWKLAPSTGATGTIYGYDPHGGNYGYLFTMGPSYFTPGTYDRAFTVPATSVGAVAVGLNGAFFTLEPTTIGNQIIRYTPGVAGTYSGVVLDNGYDFKSGLAVLPDGDVVTAKVAPAFGLERFDANSSGGYASATVMPLPDDQDPLSITSAQMVTSRAGDLYVTYTTDANRSYLVEYPHATPDAPEILESDAAGLNETFGAVTVDSAGTVFMVVKDENGISIQRRTAAGARSIVKTIASPEVSSMSKYQLTATGVDTLLYNSGSSLQFLTAPIKPSSPTAVSVSTDGGSATVTWEAPADTGSSPLSDYGVYRFVGGGAQTQSTQVCGGSTAEITESFDDLTSITTYSCTVTGLASGTYRFGVRAVSAAGYSKPAMVKFTVVVPVAFTTDLPAVSGPTPDGLVTMTVAVSGDPAPRLVWQRSLDNGTTWKNVKTEKNATTVVRSYSAKLEGAQFRVVAYPKGQPAVFSTVTTVHD